MIRLYTLTILLFSINSVFALDPQVEAQNLHGSTHGKMTFESGKEREVPNYQDSPKELEYYNSPSSMENDSFVESNSNAAGIAVQDSYYTRPDIGVRGDESFFNQSKKTMGDAAEMADFVTGEYKDCEIGGGPEGSSLMETRSCDSYITLESNSCEVTRQITVGNEHIYTCNKQRTYTYKNCAKTLSVTVEPLNQSWIQTLNRRFSGDPRWGNGTAVGVNFDNNSIYFSRFDIQNHVRNGDKVEIQLLLTQPSGRNWTITGTVVGEGSNQVFIDTNLKAYFSGKPISYAENKNYCRAPTYYCGPKISKGRGMIHSTWYGGWPAAVNVKVLENNTTYNITENWEEAC